MTDTFQSVPEMKTDYGTFDIRLKRADVRETLEPLCQDLTQILSQLSLGIDSLRQSRKNKTCLPSH